MADITFHTKIVGIILAGFLLALSKTALGQESAGFKQHEIITVTSGLNIEILKCSDVQGGGYCDVILYTQKRQSGKRRVLRSKILDVLRAPQTADSSRISSEAVLARRYVDSLFLAKDITTKAPPSIQVSPAIARSPSTDSVRKKILINSPNQPASPREVRKVFNRDSSKKTVPVMANIVTQTNHAARSMTGYSLEQIYKIGLEQNIKLRQSKNAIELASIDNKMARANVLPSVSFDLGHYFSFGKNIDPVTNTFSYETFSGGFTSLNLQLQLFGGFKKLNAIKQSSILLSAAAYNEKMNELELLANITLTYAKILLTNDELIYKRHSLEKTSKELEAIDEKIKVGRLTRYERYTFEGLLNTQKSELLSLQNDSMAALLNLKQLLNIPNQNIDLSTVDTTSLNEIQLANFTLGNVGDNILKNHPSVKLAEMNEQAAILNEKIARSALLPYLAVGGNIVSNYNANQRENNTKIPLSRQLDNNLGQNINISLRIPVFSQLQNTNRVKKEKINIKNAQLDVELARNAIIANAMQLINDFNTAKQNHIATAAAFEQNRLAFELYYEKYRLGQISSVELLAAGDILNAANSKYLQARLRMFFQFKMLDLLQKN